MDSQSTHPAMLGSQTSPTHPSPATASACSTQAARHSRVPVGSPPAASITQSPSRPIPTAQNGSSITATRTSPISPAPARRCPELPATVHHSSRSRSPSQSIPAITSGSLTRAPALSPKSHPTARSSPATPAAMRPPALLLTTKETSGSPTITVTASARSPPPGPSSPTATLAVVSARRKGSPWMEPAISGLPITTARR